jgi:hypothetical protein
MDPSRMPRFIGLAGGKDPQVHGIWDRRAKCWAEPPFVCDEAAERLAVAVNEAHAAGLAEAACATTTRGLRFVPSSVRDEDFLAWGVWDQRREGWAERAYYDLEWAEKIALLLNTTYAAGLAEAIIEKMR